MADRIKIIVAEDNPIQRQYLCVLLNKLGYVPIAAEDGQEALRLLQESNAQVIISDFEMKWSCFSEQVCGSARMHRG